MQKLILPATMKKNGSAIGSEDGDGHRGSLKLGDNMKVYAGQNPSDADKHLFPFETRVLACFFRPYARHRGRQMKLEYGMKNLELRGKYTLRNSKFFIPTSFVGTLGLEPKTSSM